MERKQVTSMLLISALLFPTIAGVVGCSSKGDENIFSDAIKNEVLEVEPDSIWFDYKSQQLKIPSTENFEESGIDAICVKDDGYVALFTGYTIDDLSSEPHILEYDNDINLISDTQITASMLNYIDGTSISLRDICVVDNEVYTTVSTFYYDSETYETQKSTVFYNVTEDEILDLSYLTDMVDTSKADINCIGMAPNGTLYMCTDGSSREIVLGKNGSYIKTIDVGKETAQKDIWGLYLEKATEDEISFTCYSDKNKLLTIDTNDMSTTVSDLAEDYIFDNSYVGEDGNTYSIEYEGIFSGDTNVMPFESTYANQEKVSYGELIKADGDKFVIYTSKYDDGEIKYAIHEFNRAESNPNAGKTIITLGCIDSVFEAIPEAISLFNQRSDNYFAKLKIYKVDYDSFDFGSNLTNEDYFDFLDSQESSIANELTMDLLSGEGPDIFLDTASMTQLNNDEYLYDISEIIDELDGVELYDNVIEASKVNGKFYQLPLAFEVTGIYALEKDVPGEKGFTFDEYVTYVDEVCNGVNPMNYWGRNEIFKKLLSSMSDEFYDENGNVDFSNEAFYNLAKYCLENVPENYYVGDSYSFGYSLGEGSLEYTQLYNIDTYIFTSQKYKDEVNIYGLPSNDGRGPSININSSIAVSAACSDYEGAKEFIKFFFTDDTKGIWNDMFTNSISVDINNAISRKAIDMNNETYEKGLKYASEEELNSWGMFKVDYTLIDEYNDMLRRATIVTSMDPSIYIIVVEEIPAYFKGQKSIEDVASIIENRAQTVINER